MDVLFHFIGTLSYWGWVLGCSIIVLGAAGWWLIKKKKAYKWFYNKAVDLAAKGEYKTALMLLEQAFKIAPYYQPITYNMGVIHLELGHKGNAKDYFYLALLNTPEDALCSYNIGLLEYEDGHYTIAIEHWFNALQYAEAPDADINYCLGLAYEALEQWDTARDVYSQGLEADPENTNCLCAAAFASLHLGHFDDCRGFIEEAIAGNEVPPEAYNTLALLEFELGNTMEAEQAAAQAYSLDPENTDILNTFACLTMMGAANLDPDKHSSALSLLESAWEQAEEGHESCIHNLAIAYAMNDDEKMAMRHLKIASKLSLDDCVKDSALEAKRLITEPRPLMENDEPNDEPVAVGIDAELSTEVEP